MSWHLIIQLLFIIGPTVFILLHRAGNSQIRVYKRFEEAKAKALAEREAQAGGSDNNDNDNDKGE